MKIAFTGTVSTGKTTLATEINKKYPELQLCTNLARSYMVNYGLKLNTESTDDTQIIFNKLFENLLIIPSFVSDRSLIDSFAYHLSVYNRGGISPYVVAYQESIVQHYMSKYDYVFYTPVEFPLVVDGQRASDLSYQQEIDNIIKMYLKKYNVKYQIIKGSVEERLKMFEDYVGI